MSALPAWCNSTKGRLLVSLILAEQPDYFVRSGQWIEGGGVKVYRGKSAGKLRRMHRDAKEKALRLDDMDGGKRFAAIVRADPDELIERLLAAPAKAVAA